VLVYHRTEESAALLLDPATKYPGYWMPFTKFRRATAPDLRSAFKHCHSHGLPDDHPVPLAIVHTILLSMMNMELEEVDDIAEYAATLRRVDEENAAGSGAVGKGKRKRGEEMEPTWPETRIFEDAVLPFLGKDYFPASLILYISRQTGISSARLIKLRYHFLSLRHHAGVGTDVNMDMFEKFFRMGLQYKGRPEKAVFALARPVKRATRESVKSTSSERVLRSSGAMAALKPAAPAARLSAKS
jgi:hypothetical protein